MPRVLVIDDEEPIRRMTRAALEPAGFDVDEACDGAAGLCRHRASPCDVILCDLVMPVQGGLQTIRELRESGDPVPVVVISGAVPPAEADWLPKPFTMAQLVGTVRAALLLSQRPRSPRPVGPAPAKLQR
jgi:DNA-binding response OmpR family regulator